MQHKNISPQDSHSPSQEQIENNTGLDVQALKCVKYTGIGTLYPSISISNATDDVRGITQAIIQNGSRGYILCYGMMYNVDTSAWAPGTSLFCDASGNLTDVSGGGPQVANVLKQDASTGVIQVTCLDTPAAGTVLVQDTDSVNLDTLGNLVTADLRLSTNPASTNNLKATTTIKSSPSKGLHIEYPFADGSTNGVLRSTDWTMFNNKVNQNDNRFSAQNVLRVKKNPGTGEFATIASALAAVTSPSATNRWIIDVAAGIYPEPQLNVPSYVYVVGQSMEGVVVEADNNNHHVFSLAPFSGLAFISVRGAGTGYAAVFAEDTGDDCIIHKIDIKDSDIGIISRTSALATGTHYLYIEYVSIENATTRAVDVSTSGSNFLRFSAENLYVYSDGTDTPVALSFNGDIDAKLIGGTLEREGGPFGHATDIENGATVEVHGVDFDDWNHAVHIGVNGTARITSASFDNNNINIHVSDATASGFFNGYTEYSKLLIDSASSFFINSKDRNIITVAKLGGDFTSVKAAVDSIISNSSTNRYTVLVGPGVFAEDTITMKEYVSVVGTSDSESIIEPDAPNKHLMIGTRFSDATNITLRGVSGSGYALIKVTGLSGWTPQEAFNINNCIFGDSDILVHAQGDTGPATIFLNDCKMGGQDTFTTGFLADSIGVGSGRMVLRNCTTVGGVPSPYPADLCVSNSPGSGFFFNSCLFSFNTASPAGNGVRISNGAVARSIGSSFRGFDKGLFVENIGAAPVVEFIANQWTSNTTDIQIDHTATTGAIKGEAAFSKINIASTSPQFALFTVDPTDPGILLNGKIRYAAGALSDTVDVAPLITDTPTMGVIDGGNLTIGTGLDVDVSAGFGYLMAGSFPNHILRKIDWNSMSITVPANTASYIYFNSSGILTSSTSLPYTATIVLLGRVVSDASNIVYIENTPLQAHHYSNQLDRLMREALGPVYASGSITTESGVRQLTVTSGKYYFSEKQYLPAGASPITWDAYYRSAIPGTYTKINNQTVVTNTDYDDGTGTLASIPTGEYAKHALYIVGGPSEKYLLVYAQATYPSLAAAETAPLPIPPGFVGDSFARLAAIIVHEGTANIVSILDERPRLGFTASSTSSTSSHSALSDLANDDHLQYLRTDGGRVMTGNLDMGGNSVTNVNLVDGVDVSAHASRHLPNGADPLTTAAPAANLSAATANATGTANSMARSDHSHAITTGTPSTITPDLANSAGTSANLARADHIHNIPTDIAVSLDANSTNTEGVGLNFARSDHTHDLSTGSASSQTPDQANAEGVSANLARADHIHNIATAVPVTVNANGINSQGAANSFSRSDHKHDVSVGTPVTQNPDQGNSAGVSTALARADHVHNIPTDAPITTLTPATTNAEGTGASFARNDHTHAIATGLVGDITTIQPDATAAAGTVDRFARADHRHAIDAAAPVTLNPDQANAEGVSTSFARADHVHNVPADVPVTLNPDQANAEGVSTSFARADHVHNVPADTAVSISTATTNAEGNSTSFARANHTHAVSVPSTEVTDTANATTTSVTDVLLTTMTTTPTAGTYLAVFSAEGTNSGNGAQRNAYSFYVGGTQVTASERFLGVGGGAYHAVSTQSIVTVNGSQAVEIRWRVAGGTGTVGQRTMILIRLSN